MGLDQNVYLMDKKYVLDRFSFKVDRDNSYDNEWWYWRKNYPLQRWMENRYAQVKTGKPLKELAEKEKRYLMDQFDCDYLLLTPNDLLDLAADIEARRLDYREKANPYFAKPEEDLKFCRNGLAVMEDGFALYYHPWW